MHVDWWWVWMGCDYQLFAGIILFCVTVVINYVCSGYIQLLKMACLLASPPLLGWLVTVFLFLPVSYGVRCFVLETVLCPIPERCISVPSGWFSFCGSHTLCVWAFVCKVLCYPQIKIIKTVCHHLLIAPTWYQAFRTVSRL